MMDPDIVWEYRDNTLFFENETLVFSIFFLDPYASRDQISEKLSSFYVQLKKQLEPFIEYYPWQIRSVELEYIDTGEYPYIFGELPYGDCIDDEWLITSQLFELAIKDPDLYVHVFDQDGEFILIESADLLPDWLSPLNGGNRLWINKGQLKIIPNSYYEDENLTLLQAIKFLEKANYNCIIDLKIGDYILEKRLSNALRNSLEHIYFEDILVDSKTSLLIQNDLRSLPNVAINQMRREQMIVDGNNPPQTDIKNSSIEELVELTIMVSAFAHAHLKIICHQNPSADEKIVKGDYVVRSINNYLLGSGTGEEDYTRYNHDEINTRGKVYSETVKKDPLQTSLLSLGRINQRIEPVEVMDLGEPDANMPDGANNKGTDDDNENDNDDDDGTGQYKDVMEKLENFFLEESDIDGIKSQQPSKKNSNIDQSKFHYDSDRYNDDSDYSSDEENEKFTNYSKDEGADIDEDSFFEFFCKDALGMSDEQIEQFRAEKEKEKDPWSAPEGASKESVGDEDEDGGYDSDENDVYNDEGTRRSLFNLLKSIKEGGGMEGPAATLMNNLSFEPPR